MSGETVIWAGQEFIVYPSSTAWHDVPGVYIFAGRREGRWTPIYVGQASSFSVLDAHGAWAEAERLGTTHVHARTVFNPDARAALEAQVIRDYCPRLNASARRVNR